MYAAQLLQAQKALLAIQTGLKPEESEVAFNIARLLHFVLARVADKEFAPAIHVLETLREGFQGIADEANDLEAKGEIPALPEIDTFQSIV